MATSPGGSIVQRLLAQPRQNVGGGLGVIAGIRGSDVRCEEGICKASGLDILVVQTKPRLEDQSFQQLDIRSQIGQQTITVKMGIAAVDGAEGAGPSL